MNQCTGHYNGTQSFIHESVFCGYVNKTIDSPVCPMKQNPITEG